MTQKELDFKCFTIQYTVQASEGVGGVESQFVTVCTVSTVVEKSFDQKQKAVGQTTTKVKARTVSKQ